MSVVLEGQESAGRLGLSFIDVVSGGFGAAFFLFLIFATLPLIEAPSRGGGSHFIDIRVRWDRPDLLLRLVVEHRTLEEPEYAAASRRVRRLDLIDRNSFDLQDDGTVTTVGEVGRRHRFWERAMAAGVSWRGAAAMVDRSGWRGMWLRLTRPCPGRLTLRVASSGVGGSVLVDEVVSTVAHVDLTIGDEAGLRRGMAQQTVVHEPGDGGYKVDQELFRVDLRAEEMTIDVHRNDIGRHCDG